MKEIKNLLEMYSNIADTSSELLKKEVKKLIIAMVYEPAYTVSNKLDLEYSDGIYEHAFIMVSSLVRSNANLCKLIELSRIRFDESYVKCLAREITEVNVYDYYNIRQGCKTEKADNLWKFIEDYLTPDDDDWIN